MAALISQNTNLKSLRYGKDRPGGGNSNQPYIQTTIQGNTIIASGIGLLGKGTGGTDFLLRGGTLTPSRAVKDVSRLTKMFFDLKSPNGVLFTAKQNLLSRTGVKTQASGILNEGAYLPTSTILQVAGNAFGIHLNKQGLNPFRNTSPDNGTGSLFGLRDPLGLNVYAQVVKSNQEKKDNRLVQLANKKLFVSPNPASSTFNTSTFFGQIFQSLSNAISISPLISPESDEILKYGGGPGSTVGIGKTIIKRSSYTNEGLDFTKNPTFKGRYYILNSAQISNIPTSKDNTQISDFRKDLLTDQATGFKKNILSKSPDYSNYLNTIEGRYKLGDPGKRNKNTTSYVTGLTGQDGQPLGALDKVTAYPLYQSENPVLDLNEVNDLVKFRIGIINNQIPSEKVYIHFRAFLDSMDDQYAAEWNPFKYMGRGENFYRYNGFTRTINLSWTIAAQSKEELIPMYQKLNFLASSLAPDFSDYGYMRGNLATLTVGGYLYEQPGIITSINYSVPQESPWEIAIGETGGQGGEDLDPSVKELPHIIKVTGFQFIPIHEFVPGKQKNTYGENSKIREFGPQRYIALSNSTGNNYDGGERRAIVEVGRTEQLPGTLLNIQQDSNAIPIDF
jgi:hypothetical protein